MSIARRLLSIETSQVKPFKFIIQTSSTDTQYELPINLGNTPNPNITVSWGDGSPSTTITEKNSTARFHTYSSAGTYQITVTGYCPSFNVNNSSYRTLYRSVVDWGEVGFQTIDFFGCINLDTLPTDGSGNATLHQGLNTVINFDSTFRETGIGFIPAGLFDFAVNVKTFINTFVFCQGITEIPSGLFDNNLLVTAFSGTFNACLNLPAIPIGLFDNNTSVVNFESVFRNCRKLEEIPNQLFTNNQSVSTFANAFNMATTANELTGVTPADANGDEIWERTPTPNGNDCFAFCTGLDNFNLIPTTFK